MVLPAVGLAALAGGAIMSNLGGRKSRRAASRARKAERARAYEIAIANRKGLARKVGEEEHSSYLGKRQLEESLARRGLMYSPSTAVDFGDELRKRMEETSHTPQDVSVDIAGEAKRLQEAGLNARHGVEGAPTVAAPTAPAAPAYTPPPEYSQATPDGARNIIEQLEQNLYSARSGRANGGIFGESRRLEGIKALEGQIAALKESLAAPSPAPAPQVAPTLPPHPLVQKDGQAAPGVVLPPVATAPARSIPVFEGSSTAREALGEHERGRLSMLENAQASISDDQAEAAFADRMRGINRSASSGGFWRGVVNSFGGRAVPTAMEYGADALGSELFPTDSERMLSSSGSGVPFGTDLMAGPDAQTGTLDSFGLSRGDVSSALLSQRRKKSPSVGRLASAR